MTAKKEIVNWKERLAEDAKAVAKAERPNLSFISLRGGSISYNGEIVPKLDVVIVAVTYDRTYYDKPWEADVQEMPRCFAQHTEESLLVPHANVVEPINAAGCHTCPLSQWGSATTGSGKGQECKLRRKLALIPLETDSYVDAEMAILSVPPTSGRYFSAYANKLASGAGLPLWAAGTEITTELDQKTQFRVNFKPLKPLAEQYLGAINDRIEAAEAILLTPFDAPGGSDDEEKLAGIANEKF